MSSYRLTNISGGQIVCDLAIEGKTLRLNNKQDRTIRENEITQHIKNLVSKGLILCEIVPTKGTKTKKNTQKSK